MAITIGGRKISAGVASKHITLPIAGMYLAKTKAGNAFTLYIDHFTSAAREHRSYKQVPLVTKDPSSLFCRMCAAFKVVLPANVTQKAAAELLAASVADYGALRCVRSGKKHDWLEIQPVNIDGEALPWGHPKKDGMVLQSLWNATDAEEEHDATESSALFSIIGKDYNQVVEEIISAGGIPVSAIADALEREDFMLEGVDMDCHSKLSSLCTEALNRGMTILKLKKN